MKTILFTLLYFTFTVRLSGQVDSGRGMANSLAEQFENLAMNGESEAEPDDNLLQQLEYLKQRPLDINTVSESGLDAFFFLKPYQAENLILYRKMLGKFINLYELQAVPGWDIETIRKIIPYISLSSSQSVTGDLKSRFRAGDRSLLVRSGRVLEKAIAYQAGDSTSPKYAGGRQSLLLRYRYQYKDLLQYGFSAQQDAGEKFFGAAQKSGFDFYSFHLFARKIGAISQLALGDFTVNLGQGLICWQSMAFGKGSEAINIKRQATVLLPYHSTAEAGFFRGAGTTVNLGNWQLSLFYSGKKQSANIRLDSASGARAYFTSIQNSGYHRTTGENSDKNQLGLRSMGGSLNYHRGNFKAGLNAVHHRFSKPYEKELLPYNAFAFSGLHMTNISMDYSFNYHNLHLFGEMATNAKKQPAMLHGLVASLDPRLDCALLYRNISRSYSSLYASPFTESAAGGAEEGLYAGMEFRPSSACRFTAYADFFSFPWLKYRVDQPSSGRDMLIQFTWKPDRQTELLLRFKNQEKSQNRSLDSAFHELAATRSSNFRANLSCRISPAMNIRLRAEMVWLRPQEEITQTGFTSFLDLFYKPLRKRYSGNIRLQIFDTDGYDTRLYAFENDVPFDFSIPALFDKGCRYYCNLSYDISRSIGTWLRFAQTIYRGKETIGSGYDLIKASHKTELNFEVIYRF